MMIETDGDCCGFMQFKYNYFERWIANEFRILYFISNIFIAQNIAQNIYFLKTLKVEDKYCTEIINKYKL